MTKGIREAAMSTPEPKIDYGYPEYSTKGYQKSLYGTEYDYDIYGGYDRSPDDEFAVNYGKKNYKTIEDIRLAPGTFEISLAIPMDSLGAAGNPDDGGYTFEGMLDMAESVAKIEIEKLIPHVKNDYSLSFDSVENIDDVTVMVTLTPKVF